MVNILPPDTSLTFIAALLVPLVLGFVIGIVIKRALQLGVAVAVLILILIFLGILTPEQVLQPLVSLVKSGPELTSKVSQISGYLPYSSVAFLVGAAVGFLK